MAISNLSNQIEYYIRELLRASEGRIKLQRSKLAEIFDCAPSQINYVLKTRFSIESGFIIESQRGGGGFIRITQIKIDDGKEFLHWLLDNIDNEISHTKAQKIIDRLEEEGYINKRESNLFLRLIHPHELKIKSPGAEVVRARFLRSIIKWLLAH
ncbi:MAG: CtsR family transcriptional regulator [Halanaerobium sp.]|nr:CtsR family transcriptional regulator [Halanaerobium sp.]